MDPRNDSPDPPLIDVFKAAALSVTKLYKSSVAAEQRSRQDGYQEAIEDLIAFLDKEGASSGEASLQRVRKWAADRRDGRDNIASTSESEDEVDKSEATPAAPEPVSMNTEPSNTITSNAQDNRPSEDVSTPNSDAISTRFVVPSQDFTFQSDHQYPNIENLDLSDTRPHGLVTHPQSRSSRTRGNRTTLRPSHLGRGAGTKRRMDFDEFFGGKDIFGNGGKRSRHN